MIHDIKKNWVEARKLVAKGELGFSVKANLLGTLIGEIEMVAKNDGQRAITDADCIAKIKAFLKGIATTIEAKEGLGNEAILQFREKNILEDFLPKQMTDKELMTAIDVICSEVDACTQRDMGKVMGALKKQYDGMYDGKLASFLVKEFLK